MDWREFSRWGEWISRWASDYHETLRERPVRAQTKFGDVARELAEKAPEEGEGMEEIMSDFERIVLPGMTHWQHPRFFAYFPANASPPSMLAEMLVSTMGAQCMLWQTSPAATEMETVVIDWLRQALGLREGYSGVIQDSASSATLSAVLTMREKATNFRGNKEGLSGKGALRVYCSEEVHSSIDRACWVAGVGQDNLVKVGTEGKFYGMDAEALRGLIREDREKGYMPMGVIAITGGTGVGASDNLGEVLRVAKEEGLYTHLDAAWAGTAMICPEFREEFWEGAEGYDSIVFNPHKWLGAQADCSVQFLLDAEEQKNALKIEPEYLKTSGEALTNYSELTIPLGRRFRALKIWFLLRSYGLEGVRCFVRDHVSWSRDAAEVIRGIEGFRIVTEPILSLFTFRCAGDDEKQQRLVDALNDDGRIYLTQGWFRGERVIRFQVGSLYTTREDVLMGADVIREVWEKMR